MVMRCRLIFGKSPGRRISYHLAPDATKAKIRDARAKLAAQLTAGADSSNLGLGAGYIARRGWFSERLKPFFAV